MIFLSPILSSIIAAAMLTGGYAFAQTLAPVESTSILSWPTAIVAVVVALALGFFIGRKFGKDPAAELEAKAELAALITRGHGVVDALADKVRAITTNKTPDAPATVVVQAPAMTPEQVAAAKATIAHLQSQVAASEPPPA